MDPAVKALVRHELMGDEGTVLRVYDDATGKPIGPGSHVIGNPSIGTGRNLSGRGISMKENDDLLDNDMAECEADLAPILPWVTTLSPGRQMVIYTLYFNVGLGNARHFIAKWPKFLAQMEAKQFEEAAANLETTQPWSHEVGPRAPRLANFVRHG